MTNPHYIPTGEGESAEGLRERHSIQQAGELPPQVQASAAETLTQVTQVLETPKMDLAQAMNYQIVDISTLTGNESEGQLKAMIAKGIRTTSVVVSDDIAKYIKSMDSTYSDELFLRITQAIDEIMKGIQDKLNEQLSASGTSQIALPEEMAIKLSNLAQKVENAGSLGAQDLEEINIEKGVKIGRFIRSIFSGGKKANLKANVKEIFKSNVQRLKDLEELNPEIEKITGELQQFPLLAIEEINDFLSKELYLTEMANYIDTVLRQKMKESTHIEDDLKGVLDDDITGWVHAISYLANVLKFASAELIKDIASSGVLSKDMRRDFLTAKYTTIIAAKSSQTRDVLKKGVQIVDGIHQLEQASLDSITIESKAITEAINSLKEGQLATVRKLNDAAIKSKELSVKTAERKAKLGQDMGKAMLDLSANTKELQQHLLGVKK